MANSTFSQVETSIFEIMSALARDSGAINLGQGFPEGLEPRELIEAAVAALRGGPHQYPPMMGLPALRQAVADNSRRFFGLDADWEREVMVTSGATEALADCFLALLEPGDEVIVFEPVYDSYAPIIRRGGAVPVAVKLAPPDWRLPFEQVRAAITPRTRALVVNTPMNPIGKVFDETELRFLADLMLEHDLVAICDEVYEHLVFDDARHASLFGFADVRDRVARIGSAGKTFSVTGWKVGYVMADAKLLGPIARAHQFVTFTTPPALQAAVAAGLVLPDSYFAGLKQALRDRRDVLTKGLNQLGFVVRPAQATYFAVADFTAFDRAGDDLAFCRRMVAQAGVAAIPLSAFYARRDLRGHIRFCFAKQRDTLERALDHLTRWV
ncbi:aminotransferase [Rhodoblastus sphagnicola]|uniref:aspartate transaminase n=1 Tax=Rhodoblastus sphagnicola TaxID=333368 RepID=A0A2S6NDV9_9HYPH|nr:aminotransferase [Rhodoblastus sphagnicola]MBB4198487.1 aspartate/methionine/tyrosine aminotransferase [Rhodoblastus sphagnicola]PPQ32791.1 aminotransferase [Rhodoblastus sphagnicola]